MKIFRRDYKTNVKYGYYDFFNFVTHREDGPAEIWNDNTLIWYNNGQIHREDGPAYLRQHDGMHLWFFLGNNISSSVNQWLKDHNIDNWEVMTDEDKLALSFFMRSCEDEELPVVNISN